MQIVIMTPTAEEYFTKEQRERMASLGANVAYLRGGRALDQVQELLSEDQKIIAVDPDFCEWKVPKETIDKMKNVQAICLQTTSFSWIDTDYCKGKGIPVTNLRGFSAEGVAEWATLMALALARKVPAIAKRNWKGDYSKDVGMELRGKTAGIVGLGTNGKHIAEICQGMGMNVIYWSKTSKDNRFKYVDLAELMKTSDVVFPAFAHNKETEGLLSDNLLRSMKKTAIFISTIHKIYNHELLLSMVKDGSLFGYGFEQGMSDSKDFDTYQGNVWAGPEMAWATEESMRKNAELWTDAICSAAKGAYPTRIN